MSEKVFVSTPSRICLFGEHQDYLGLEVIASAINLRFFARGTSRDDKIIHVRLTGENIKEEKIIDLSIPVAYDHKRDYLKSAVNILKRNGYPLDSGYDIYMHSDIPIGKGMSSSTTMAIVFIKILLELMDSEDKDDADKIAELGFQAEVAEFNEPGGMMDHYTSAVGGLVHITFDPDRTVVRQIPKTIPGSFILFDSMQDKDTTSVLANAKMPVIQALKQMNEFGITSVRDFVGNKETDKYMKLLDQEKRIKLAASIDNYKVLREALELLEGDSFSPEKLGHLLKRHHANLRDGLGISTPVIEKILNTACSNGALGGKINGSGGGGCCYVYAYDDDCSRIVKSVRDLGYPAYIIKQDSGVRRDREESRE